MRRTRAALVAATVVLACGPVSAGEEGTPLDEEPTVFPSTNRPDVRGIEGAVSAGHPLAAAAGIDVLRRGGNAVDATIAMAAVLAVVRPHMNGVGGDAFGLFFRADDGTVTALNGSGRAGARAARSTFSEAGHVSIPEVGPLSVSVPGAVAAWVDAHSRYGSLSFSELLAPAIRYAEEGFPVSRRLADDFEAQGTALNSPGRDKYLPGGSAPPVGSRLRNPALAATLTTIATGGAAAFYRGSPGRRLAAFVDSAGGTLTADDFARHRSSWVEPLTIDYLGSRLHVLPPNTQGMAQLAMAEMAKHHPLKEMGHNTSSYLHTLVELKKLAFADRDSWVADPEFSEVPVQRLLDPEYLASRSSLVDPDRATEAVSSGIPADAPVVAPRDPPDDAGDTVYLTAVDRWGNGVSWIQSLFHGFGSGLFEPVTGVVLHNRGSLYSLDPEHPNVVAPGKRPYHTLTPLLATTLEGELDFTMGTPGGDSQVQSLLQIINNLRMFGMNPQAAIEAPRFRSYPGTTVDFEDRVAPHVLEALAGLGHDVRVVHGWTATFGGAQMIVVDRVNGTLVAAADPRREAYALAY